MVFRSIQPAPSEPGRERSSGKASRAEVAARVEKVYEWLILGARRAQILQFAAKEHWGVSDRTVDTYIARANKLLETEAATHRDREMGRALGRLNLLFANAISLKETRDALAVQKEINALLGLYAPTQVNVTSWEDRAIADIKTGAVTFEALAEAFSVDLATQLFARAGVPVSTGAGAQEE